MHPAPLGLLPVPRRIRKGASVFRMGDPFHSVYIVRSGSFKTVFFGDNGSSQILDFHMAEDVIGMEGIGSDRYASTAVALEDSEACAVPLTSPRGIAASHPDIQEFIAQALSRQLRRDQRRKFLLGRLSAQERVASFLADLSDRHAHDGHGSRQFMLRMNRKEIGDCLGLSLETVCRSFKRLKLLDLIKTQRQYVCILDVKRLREMGHGTA